MYTRRSGLPRRSFFLLGPRATGKTTWLKQVLPGARVFNLLLDRELVKISSDMASFRAELDALSAGSWVVIDEVQRLPEVLNEVHDVMGAAPRRLNFALTGSSARKLKRGNANLLAGRASWRQFFPLAAEELDFDLVPDEVLRFGLLPEVRTEERDSDRLDLLEGYRATYLAEEVRNEGLVKSLPSFQRFLEVAALMNGQLVNVAGLARDCGVARPTVQGYFDALTDTMIGSFLPAFRPGVRMRETGHPKFYFFDPGVARILSARARLPLESAERGPLLETWIFHELRAWIHHRELGGQLSYWRSPAGLEVDFVWSRDKRRIALEIKASDRWRESDCAGLNALTSAMPNARAIGVYLGSARLKFGPIEIYPVLTFLRELASGRLLAR